MVAMVAPRAARGSVHDGVGGDGDCVDGVALCLWTLEWSKGSNGLAVVLRLLGSRNPSEWSVGLGFHLNGPLCLGFHLYVPLGRWNEQALMISGVSWRHPPLGPSASGSLGSLPRLSARRSRTSNTPRTTHVTGGLRLTAYAWQRGVPTSGNREKETGEFSDGGNKTVCPVVACGDLN